MQSLISYSHRPVGFSTDLPAVAFSHCHITSKQDRWQCPGISWGYECHDKGQVAQDGLKTNFPNSNEIYWCTARVTLTLLDMIKLHLQAKKEKQAWNQSHLVLIKTHFGALINMCPESLMLSQTINKNRLCSSIFKAQCEAENTTPHTQTQTHTHTHTPICWCTSLWKTVASW